MTGNGNGSHWPVEALGKNGLGRASGVLILIALLAVASLLPRSPASEMPQWRLTSDAARRATAC
jgi:hypothetical protein